MNMISHTSIAALAMFAACVVQAQAPDNTKQNSVDSTNKSATADMQHNSKADLMLTQQIRKSLVADKALSTYAHNIKIVAMNGNVTLTGVVRTAEEKAAVEAKARATGVSGDVVNNLKVAP